MRKLISIFFLLLCLYACREDEEFFTRNFITDGTEQKIKIPYGIMVNPLTKDIYVTDAKNYVSLGTLYCFDKDGKQKWNFYAQTF
jgi:DNA-binding beta-propeller fold protein YncE